MVFERVIANMRQQVLIDSLKNHSSEQTVEVVKGCENVVFEYSILTIACLATLIGLSHYELVLFCLHSVLTLCQRAISWLYEEARSTVTRTTNYCWSRNQQPANPDEMNNMLNNRAPPPNDDDPAPPRPGDVLINEGFRMVDLHRPDHRPPSPPPPSQAQEVPTPASRAQSVDHIEVADSETVNRPRTTKKVTIKERPASAVFYMSPPNESE